MSAWPPSLYSVYDSEAMGMKPEMTENVATPTASMGTSLVRASTVHDLRQLDEKIEAPSLLRCASIALHP